MNKFNDTYIENHRPKSDEVESRFKEGSEDTEELPNFNDRKEDEE